MSGMKGRNGVTGIALKMRQGKNHGLKKRCTMNDAIRVFGDAARTVER